MRARLVVVFLRAPRLGRVKRRLARGIGDLAALAFHRATATRLLRDLARDRRWRVHVAVTPDRRAFLPRAWRVGERRGQGGGDLGRRMARAFTRLPPGPAVLVGADIPELGPRHVAAAFAALGTHDAVFGPAQDGGYWLVGFARRAPLPRGVFAGVRWSSESALADTLASLPRRLRVALLETLADVDDEDAYRRSLIRRRRGALGAAASARRGCTGGGGCRAGA
jgi:rSAM/selenodomain-associated transferase 1